MLYKRGHTLSPLIFPIIVKAFVDWDMLPLLLKFMENSLSHLLALFVWPCEGHPQLGMTDCLQKGKEKENLKKKILRDKETHLQLFIS